MFIQNHDISVCIPNSSGWRYDDSPSIKGQKVSQLSCSNKIVHKKSNTSLEIFSEIIEKTNNQLISLTKPLQFNNYEPLKLNIVA